MIVSAGISYLPRTVAKREHRLEKSDHHVLAGALHDHLRKQHDVVRSNRLGIVDRAPERVGLEEHVGIGEEQPVAGRVVRSGPHGMRFAEPSRRQFVVMNHPQARGRKALPRPGCVLCDRVGLLLTLMFRDAFHDRARRIGRPVIDRDHFVAVIVERQQLIERLFDALLFVAGGNDDGNAGISGRQNGIAITLRTGNIGDTRHAESGIYDAGEPGQRQKPASPKQ